MTHATGTPETATSDHIVLTLPGDPRLRTVASLVLGGIGSRLDLAYEKVDELQLAVLTILGAADIDSATIEVEIEDGSVLVTVGPLPVGTSEAPGLHTVLERLVDGVDTSSTATETGSAEWVALRLARPPAA